MPTGAVSVALVGIRALAKLGLVGLRKAGTVESPESTRRIAEAAIAGKEQGS